jgi:hypothetical protein
LTQFPALFGQETPAGDNGVPASSKVANPELPRPCTAPAVAATATTTTADTSSRRRDTHFTPNPLLRKQFRRSSAAGHETIAGKPATHPLTRP